MLYRGGTKNFGPITGVSVRAVYCALYMRGLPSFYCSLQDNLLLLPVDKEMSGVEDTAIEF